MTAYEGALDYQNLMRAVRWEWGDDAWQAAALECLMLPEVWAQLGAVLQAESHPGQARAHQHYGVPERGTFEFVWQAEPRVLPGYALGTAEGATLRWCDVGFAGRAWDGMRREIDGTLGYALQYAAHELWRRRALLREDALPEHERTARVDLDATLGELFLGYRIEVRTDVALCAPGAETLMLRAWIPLLHAEALLRDGLAERCPPGVCGIGRALEGRPHVHALEAEPEPRTPGVARHVVGGKTLRWDAARGRMVLA